MSIRSPLTFLACVLWLAPIGAAAVTVSYLGDFAGFDAAAPGLGVVDFDATALMDQEIRTPPQRRPDARRRSAACAR